MTVTMGVADKETSRIYHEGSDDRRRRGHSRRHDVRRRREDQARAAGRDGRRGQCEPVLRRRGGVRRHERAGSAARRGLQPLGVFRAFAVAGCEPDEMGIGPVFAVRKLLARTGIGVDDIDLWEMNEAFAVQVIYCRDTLGIPNERLNVERRRDRGRASVRRVGRAPDGPCADRRPPARRKARRRDDVHRRRHGRGGIVRDCVKFGLAARRVIRAVGRSAHSRHARAGSASAAGARRLPACASGRRVHSSLTSCLPKFSPLEQTDERAAARCPVRRRSIRGT